MYTIEYFHQPGDEVFVILDTHCIRKGTVVQVDGKVFLRNENIKEILRYLVLLDESKNTHYVDECNIFKTLEAAINKIEEPFIGITADCLDPTPTPTVTPSTTPIP